MAPNLDVSSINWAMAGMQWTLSEQQHKAFGAP
jgi:hypothetical protein